MRLAHAATAALLLAGCTAVAHAAGAPAAATLAPLPASITSELPRNARPSHYSVEITPDAQALTFTGKVAIDLQLFEPGRTITLLSNRLELKSARLAPAAGGAPVALEIEPDPATETVLFIAPDVLAPGGYRLEVEYSGRINRRPSGFFAMDYIDKRTGGPARGLFTQFEAPDAREFMPSFDEPAYKATFDLTAVVPEGQMAVSNMPATGERPLGNGKKRVTFATSPLMSTYLLFLGVGDFERISEIAPDGTEVGIVSPAGSGETARYALDSLVPLMAFYKDYFGVDYPLPKLDNVAAPGSSQQFGAMENWGSILTFEKYLLLDPRNTSPAIQQYLYSAQAHEVAHQWFGDLVTISWWDDLWLNEGFASWMETKATEHFKPDWHADIGRVGSREAAMRQDSLASTHPIVVRVKSAAEADQAFDAISYSKGETIITMLEGYAGPDVWRDGIRRYFARHAYGNTTTVDLWRAVEEAGARDLSAVADAFTRQAGIPLVTAQARCEEGRTRLSLAQGQFSRDEQEKVAANPGHWLVPLTIRTADGATHRQVLDGSATIGLPGCGPVIVNGGQLGYFRTLYTPETLAQLTAAVPALPPIEQLGLMSDNLALSAAGYQDYGPALGLLSAIPQDAYPIVAQRAATAWLGLYLQLDGEQAKASLAAVVRDKWSDRLERLGYDPKAGESLAETDLRSDLLRTLGTMGDPAVTAEARGRFAALATDPRALDGPLKTTWLGIATRHAGEAEWALLRTLADRATGSVERSIYLAQLGGTADDALARRALELAIGGSVEPVDGAAIIANVANLHPEMAYAFAESHKTEVDALLDDSARPEFLAELVATSTDPAMVARLEALRAARPAAERLPVDKALTALKERLASYPRTRAQVGAWLAAR